VDFEDALFWSVALVRVVVAVRFSVLMYEVPRQLTTQETSSWREASSRTACWQLCSFGRFA